MVKIMTKKLKIKGMHCSSCAFLIEGDLEDLPQIKKALVSYAKEEAIIEYDENKITLVEITQIIKRSGFLASVDEAK